MPRDRVESRAILRYPIVTAGDVVPFFPNVLATIAGFVFLMIAPGLLLWLAERVTDDILPIIEIGPFWNTGTLILTTIVSLGAASLFLVIGVILQFWHHHRPFALWLPVAAGVSGGLGPGLARVLGARRPDVLLDLPGIPDRVRLFGPVDGPGRGTRFPGLAAGPRIPTGPKSPGRRKPTNDPSGRTPG